LPAHATQKARIDVPDQADRARRFRDAALPHLDAAYNLARWLTGNNADAEDAVQESYLRAQRYFDNCRGDARAWLLAIVRHACYDSNAERGRRHGGVADIDTDVADTVGGELPRGPERRLADKQEGERLNRILRGLPVEYREVLVLREIEEYSYRDIARIIGVPAGTVMSRLSRARRALVEAHENGERKSGLL
jgi:RNA polymerase sigma-70 factor (ECF subfamily)